MNISTWRPCKIIWRGTVVLLNKGTEHVALWPLPKKYATINK
jgi:hypothetical protein